MALVSTKYREFLIESQGFYLNLISKIYFLFGSINQNVISELGVVLLDHSEYLAQRSLFRINPLPSPERVYSAIYKCLIALGDIARYKESTLDKVQGGQYQLSKKYYWIALHLIPESGNTYNQLAVLEAYCHRHAFALDLYFRRYFMKFVL